jgi:rubrerythrin
MTDVTNTSTAGFSVWERDLYVHLTSHVDRERGLLEQYKSAAQTSPSKAMRYLVDLLIEDEIRHHKLFNELAQSLKAEAELAGREPMIPYLDFNDPGNGEAVTDLTDQLLKQELEDAQELKRLGRELRDVKDTSLWSILVDLMQRDTEKHIAILRFAKKHTRRSKG